MTEEKYPMLRDPPMERTFRLSGPGVDMSMSFRVVIVGSLGVGPVSSLPSLFI